MLHHRPSPTNGLLYSPAATCARLLVAFFHLCQRDLIRILQSQPKDASSSDTPHIKTKQNKKTIPIFLFFGYFLLFDSTFICDHQLCDAGDSLLVSNYNNAGTTTGWYAPKCIDNVDDIQFLRLYFRRLTWFCFYYNAWNEMKATTAAEGRRTFLTVFCFF